MGSRAAFATKAASLVLVVGLTLVALRAFGDRLDLDIRLSPDHSGDLENACAAPAEAAAVFTLYLDPAGSDANCGQTPDDPLLSIARAQELLAEANPRTDVELRIAPGEYRAAPVRWTFFVPGRTIRFLPVGYDATAEGPPSVERPIFRGNGDSGYWMMVSPPPEAVFDSRLEFHHLRVQEYDFGGIAVNGGISERDGLRAPAGAGLNGNVIKGMHFALLGSAWAGRQHGYGAIDLVNSSKNLIIGNRFEAIENAGAGGSMIHAVYLAHHSRENVVRDNHFERISGDPLRVRNDSNDNRFYHNTFREAGNRALLSDWFCDTACAETERRARECASHGNVLHHNQGSTGYSGAEIRSWAVTPAGLDYAGGPGCANNGQSRIRTYGNT